MIFYKPTGNYYYFPLRQESKYRYSGLLYDKLRCLFSYAYLDASYRPHFSEPDQLHYAACRFDARIMVFNYMYNRNTGDYTPYYLEESVARSLHFINS